MIKPNVEIKDYMKLSNEQRSKVFNELATKILIVHPDFLQESKNVDAVNIIEEIQEETKNLKVIKKKIV